jgi:carbon storage regulator
MLVLSRKKNETIIIDDQITVTIVEIRGDKVKLGIEAPPSVSVDRREVWEAKRRNQPNSTNSVSQDRTSY